MSTALPVVPGAATTAPWGDIVAVLACAAVLTVLITTAIKGVMNFWRARDLARDLDNPEALKRWMKEE